MEGKASTKTAANANAGLADVQDMNALRSNLDELVTHTITLVNMIAKCEDLRQSPKRNDFLRFTCRSGICSESAAIISGQCIIACFGIGLTKTGIFPHFEEEWTG